MPQFDRDQVLAELSGEQEAPEVQEEPTQQEIEQIEYILGEQSNKLPVNAEFKVTHDGQVVKAPLSKIVNAFRLRSKLDDDMAAYKNKYAEFEKKTQEFGNVEELQNKLKPYQELQTWSEKLEQENPEAFKHLTDTIERVKNGLWKGTSDTSEANAVISAVRRELDETKKELSSIKDWKSQFELQKDIELVSQEAKQFQEKYGKKLNIDLNEKDETGLSLENRILKYGAENNHPTFKSAALEYLEDKLLETAMNQGRTEAVKGIQQDKKSGIVAKSSKPFSGQGSEDVSRLGREELKERAVEELRGALTQ